MANIHDNEINDKIIRESGIDSLGDVHWGSHFCLFYQTAEDLLDILVPYFKAGLDNNEFCMWITSEPVEVEKAKSALDKAINNLDSYISKGQIEILNYKQWYIKSGVFYADCVLKGWIEKEAQAVNNGFEGLRLSVNTFWLEKKNWTAFKDYEAIIDNVINQNRMLALCTYSLDKCSVAEVMDVVSNHESAMVKRGSEWEVIESVRRKRAEKARLKAEAELKYSIEVMPGIIAKANALTGYFIYCNSTLGDILGFSSEEFMARPFIEFIHPDDRQATINEVEKQLKGCRVARFENRYICKNGSYRWLEWTASEADENGIVFATALDITERMLAAEQIKNQNILLEKAVKKKQQEMELLMERLIRQEKLAAVGQISGSIAHELRNPLSAIKQSIFFLNRLLEKNELESSGAKVKKHFELLCREIDESNKVISDLLQMSKMDSLEKNHTNLRSVISEVLDRFPIEKNIKLNIDLKPEPFLIWADPLQLRQVLLNLLSNATFANSKKRIITISAKMSDKNKKCYISFQDDGPGITPENLEKVFEPLYTSKVKGIGLGLSICKQIIENHGGTITLTSKIGKGTTVSIELPNDGMMEQLTMDDGAVWKE